MTTELKTRRRKIVRVLPIEIDGIWASDDFSRFLDAVSAIYLYFAVENDQARRQASKYAPMLRESHGTFHYVYDSGETADGALPSTELWKALQFKRAELILLADELRTFVRAHGAIEWAHARIQPTLGVQVRSIRYGSLGEINFKGLGEPLEQGRELLKDLTYRNALERDAFQIRVERTREEARNRSEFEELQIEQKRLEVLQQKLDILRDLGVPNDVLARAVLSPEHLDTVKELKARRLIREIGELHDE